MLTSWIPIQTQARGSLQSTSRFCLLILVPLSGPEILLLLFPKLRWDRGGEKGFRTRPSKDFGLIPPQPLSDLEWVTRRLLVIFSSCVRRDTVRPTSQGCCQTSNDTMYMAVLYQLWRARSKQRLTLLPEKQQFGPKIIQCRPSCCLGQSAGSRESQGYKNLSKNCNPIFLCSPLTTPMPGCQWLGWSHLKNSVYRKFSTFLRLNGKWTIPPCWGWVRLAIIEAALTTAFRFTPYLKVFASAVLSTWTHFHLVFRGLVPVSPFISNVSASSQHSVSLFTPSYPVIPHKNILGFLFFFVVCLFICFSYAHPYLLTCLILSNPPDSRSLWK